MDILGLSGKSILIFGVANRKSVAWCTAKQLTEAGARCVYVVRDEQVKQQTAKLLAGADVYTCDVEKQEEIDALARTLVTAGEKFDGLLHSIAFADYSQGIKPFHETPREAFLQAVDISCYSLVAISNALKVVPA